MVLLSGSPSVHGVCHLAPGSLNQWPQVILRFCLSLVLALTARQTPRQRSSSTSIAPTLTTTSLEDKAKVTDFEVQRLCQLPVRSPSSLSTLCPSVTRLAGMCDVCSACEWLTWTWGTPRVDLHSKGCRFPLFLLLRRPGDSGWQRSQTWQRWCPRPGPLLPRALDGALGSPTSCVSCRIPQPSRALTSP